MWKKTISEMVVIAFLVASLPCLLCDIYSQLRSSEVQHLAEIEYK